MADTETTDQQQSDSADSSTQKLPQQTEQTQTQAQSDSDSGDSSGLKKALESERQARAQAERDAKARAKELAEAKAELQKRDDAEKSEGQKAVERAEKAEADLAKAQASIREKTLRHAVASAARDLGFHNPDVAYKLLDLKDVTFDEDDEPQGVADLVKALAKDHEYLVKSEDAKKGPPPTERQTRNGNGLTPEEDNAHKAAFAFHTRSNF